MTAIYIRTFGSHDRPGIIEPWCLPESINADTQISKLASYARSHRYTDMVFYLDDGSAVSSIMDPANTLLHQEVMAGRINTVIVSDLHQIPGGMNILMMMNDFFHEHGIRLIIADLDKDADEVIRTNYDVWIKIALDHSLRQIGSTECKPADEVFDKLVKDLLERETSMDEAIQSAPEVPPRLTPDGYPLINAQAALWLLRQ